MKEIIKYLRVTHDFTQDDVAAKLGVTRQSYIKYENGTVTPSAKTVSQLAAIYGVEPAFIYQNKIPEIQNPQYKIHKIDDAVVSSPAPVYSDKPQENVRVYDAYFDGTAVKVLDPGFTFTKGQRFKLVVDADEEKAKRRERSRKILESYMYGNKGLFEFSEDDPYYKKAIGRAKEEKYGPVD